MAPRKSSKSIPSARTQKLVAPARAARATIKPPPVARLAKPAKPTPAAKGPRTGASKAAKPTKASKANATPLPKSVEKQAGRAKKQAPTGAMLTVRHMNRRDMNDVWDFLKISFRDVNLETVEFQRPRSKQRFEEIFAEDGIDQLIFEIGDRIVAYAECSYEVIGSDNWINPRYFEKRDMRPLFVEELAVHPEVNGLGVGTFVLEQLHHIARVHGLNHLVLEVAENNERALGWYKKRAFKKLDAAIFMACPVDIEPELLPPRELPPPRVPAGSDGRDDDSASE